MEGGNRAEFNAGRGEADEVQGEIEMKPGNQPAFPVLEDIERFEDDLGKYVPHLVPKGGMTMRQYYKAAALQGITQAFGNFQSVAECSDKVAVAVAKIADAMIEEDLAHEKKGESK